MNLTTQQQYIQEASKRYDSHGPGMYPAKKIAIVTCMDTRIEPLRGFGIDVGEAHILRNAGGRVTEDVLRSLVLSSAALGVTEVGVFHHTQCGVGAAEADLRQKVSETLGTNTGDMVFHGFTSLEESVAHDVSLIKEHPLLAKVQNVWGGVIDIDTHHVTMTA